MWYFPSLHTLPCTAVFKIGALFHILRSANLKLPTKSCALSDYTSTSQPSADLGQLLQSQKSRLLTLLTHVWRGKTRQIFFGVKYKLFLWESTRRHLVHFANRQSRLLLVYGQNAWESFYPNTFFRLPTPDTLCKAPGLLKCETNLSQSMFLT